MTGEHATQALVRQQLCDWFGSALGAALQAEELARLTALLPDLFATVAVQIGAVGGVDLLQNCVAPTRVVLDLAGAPAPPGLSRIVAEPEYLPLEGRSVDLAVLPHTLEFAADPHQVLREVQRVLRPEGHVVVLGFNPFSLWGLRRLAARRASRMSAPWCGEFLHLTRIKDWLKLLDFELAQGGMLFYRPPLRNERVMERLRVLDKLGDRWWPMAGAVYLLVAKKRVPGMTALRPAWRVGRVLGGVARRPATRGVAGWC